MCNSFDVDPNTLRKGQDLSRHYCAKILGYDEYPRDTETYKRFSIDLLKLRDHFMKFERDDEVLLSVKIVNDGIHVNTDLEAAEYHTHQSDLAMRRMYRHVKYLQTRVARQKLTHEQQEEYDRQRTLYSQRVAFTKKNNRSIAARNRGLGVKT